MNPKIAIVVDAKNKAISTLTGMVTVGSKIDVDVSGIASSDVPNWTATDKFTGPSLRFRVVDEFGHDLVRYQLHEKTETTPDVWTLDSANSKFTASNVDFNTDVLRKAFCGVPFDEYREFGLILDSVVDAAQYAVGKIKIRQWASSSMEDPTILPDWREVLAELESDLDDVQSAKDTAVSAATSATSSASSATSSASSATSSANLAQTLANNAATSASSASSSASRAEVASSHYPKISTENNHWLVWDATATIPGYVDTGISAKGEKGEVEKVLEGETMESNPTQRQLATALKTVWAKLGGTIACLMACLFANADVTRETEWQDVPPETKIGTVVDLGQGGGGISHSVVTNIAGNVVSNVVPSWAREANPPAMGVTDVKVDGTSVVSGGVANLTTPEKVKDGLLEVRADGTQVIIATGESPRIPGYGYWVLKCSAYPEIHNKTSFWNSATGTWRYFKEASSSWFHDEYSIISSNLSYSVSTQNGTKQTYFDTPLTLETSEPQQFSMQGQYASLTYFTEKISAPVETTIVNEKQITNIVNSISSTQITNHVSSGYLCTVEAAQAMTNRLIRSDSNNVVTFDFKLTDDIGNKIIERDVGLWWFRGWADCVMWSGVSGKPTTLSGYGITDAYTKTEVDGIVSNKENKITAGTGIVVTHVEGLLNYRFSAEGSYHYVKQPPSRPGDPSPSVGTSVQTYSDEACLVEESNHSLENIGSYEFESDIFQYAGLYAVVNVYSLDAPAPASTTVSVDGNYISSTSVTNGGAVAEAKAYTDDATNALATVAHSGSYNDLSNKPTIPAPVSDSHITNIAEAVVGEVMEYAFTNLTGAAIALVSGEIGNATITANTSVTLDFSNDANKSGDCMLYAINATATDYTISPQPTEQYTFVSADLAKALTIGKATTNVLSFTRLNANTVLVGKLEVK